MAAHTSMRELATVPEAETTVWTLDGYLPPLYALAPQGDGEGVTLFADKVTLGSMSML